MLMALWPLALCRRRTRGTLLDLGLCPSNPLHNQAGTTSSIFVEQALPMWPFDFLRHLGIDLVRGPPFLHYTPRQINEFVRTETRKTDAILNGNGIELSRLVKRHPLGENDHSDGSLLSAVRKGIAPGDLDTFCRFMVDNGAWLTPDCWENYDINIGPDPDYWMLYEYLAKERGTFLEQYYRLKYLSNTARVMEEWQDAANEFADVNSATWLSRARASQWVGADVDFGTSFQTSFGDAPGILLVYIYDVTRKTFPLYAKACEEALFDIHDGEDVLDSVPTPDGDSFESIIQSIMDGDDRVIHDTPYDEPWHPLTLNWRLRLRLAALRAKRLHELAFTFLVFVKWYPKIMAWMMRAREKAYAPGGAGYKRSREHFEAVQSSYTR